MIIQFIPEGDFANVYVKNSLTSKEIGFLVCSVRLTFLGDDKSQHKFDEFAKFLIENFLARSIDFGDAVYTNDAENK